MKPFISDFAAYKRIYEQSIQRPEIFWSEVASQFHWKIPHETIMTGSLSEGDIKWFDGAKLNITFNCLDRHLESRGDETALIWEPNEPRESIRTWTYTELYTQTCKLANALKKLGISKGDRVCIYMPMIPEAVASMLACARIGAIHTVVFAGFSAAALKDRINDCGCTLVITADSFYRGTKKIDLKSIVDQALVDCPQVKKCLVYKHRNEGCAWMDNRDIDYASYVEPMPQVCEPTWVAAEDPLFILYTSGSTGKPKGLLHTTAGYMVYSAYTFATVFQYQQGDIHWCTADIGWVTGHSYMVYGPLLNGATSLIFEGVPNHPTAERFWQVIEKHRVNIFYTAPTAIRSLQAYGDEPLIGKDLSSLKVIGSVGEPINEDAWHWYDTQVGKNRIPLVDTWWQTETGGILISPIAGITPLKPTFATLPLPGIAAALMNEKGEMITAQEAEGNLCITAAWPGIARSIWGDHERYIQTYLSTYNGYYFTGDGAKRDQDGYYRITGRVDDVINVSGHRIGTGEVEDAINEHAIVVESAVVACHHQLKGQGIYAYIICNELIENETQLIEEVKQLVSSIIGAFAKPDYVQIVSGLPKTRSGKIMRRILRKIAENDNSNFGDTSTLLDPATVDAIWENRLIR